MSTPDQHYARGLELLDTAERSIELFQIQANATLAQGHFSAAVAGAALAMAHQQMGTTPEPAAEHQARLAAEPKETP